MPRGNKANRADKEEHGKLLEAEIATMPKKKRIQYMLVSAYQNDQWLTIKDLEHVASRGYIYTLITEWTDKGLIISRQIPVKMIVGGFKRLTKLTGWRATDKLVSLVSSEQKGLPPRSLKKRMFRKVKDERHGKLDVYVREADASIGVDGAYTEELKVWIQMNPAVAEALRQKMQPPGQRDRADQYSLKTEAFSVTISAKDKAQFNLHTILWHDALKQLCVIAGVSKRATNTLVSQINQAIPEGFTKVEFPLFMPGITEIVLEYNIDTAIINEETGESTGYFVSSNINKSLITDWEVLGKVYAVDNLLSTLSAMQHNSAVTYQSIKHKMLKEAEEREEKEKAAEQEMLQCSCEEPKPVLVAGKYLCQQCGRVVTKDQLKALQEEEEKDEDNEWMNYLV